MLISGTKRTEKFYVRDLMIKTPLFLCLLVLGQPTFAQSERLSQAFTETIIDLGANGQGMGGQIFCRENPQEFNFGPDQTELVDNCMKTLCGSPQQNPTTSLTEHNITQFVDRAAQQEVERLRGPMEEALRSEQERNNRFIEKARELGDGGNLQINPESLYPQNWIDIVKRVYGPYVRSYADAAAPLNERFQVNVRSKIKSKAQGTHEAFLTDFARQYEDFVNNGPWYVKIQHGVTTVSESRRLLREAYERERPQMQEALDNDSVFEKVWGGYDRERFEVLEQAMDSLDKLGEKELKILADLYVETHSSITDTPGAGREFCASGACREGINQYLANLNLEEVLDDLEGQNNSRAIGQVMRECRYQVMADNILRPDSRRIREAYPEVLEKFNQNVLSRYSEHSRNQFNQIAARELELDVVNYGGNNVANALAASFNAIKTRNQIEVESETPIDNNDILVWLFRKNNRSQISYADGVTWNVKPFQDVNPCGGKTPNVGGDHFALTDDPFDEKPYQINLSAHTCTHIHAGKATLAHELGHLLSRVFLEGRLSRESYAEYGNLRQCSSLGYKNMESLPPSFLELNGGHPGDTIKTEEDMADLIGMMTMGLDPERPPGACVLLRPSANQVNYDHRNLYSHPDSGHSTAPLRVLIEAIHQRRPLSPGCRELLQSNVSQFRFGSCFQ